MCELEESVPVLEDYHRRLEPFRALKFGPSSASLSQKPTHFIEGSCERPNIFDIIEFKIYESVEEEVSFTFLEPLFQISIIGIIYEDKQMDD
jgi:hypothetical protein